MSSGTLPRSSTDLGTMRATAHPTRVGILTLLRQHRALTATECANLLNVSAKTCSYHLHTLAAHGLVVEVPATGRNRPWRRSHDDAGDTASGEHLVRGKVLDARIQRDETNLQEASAEISEAALSPTWSNAAIVHTRIATMSPPELQAWCEDVERLTRRHLRRSAAASELDEMAGRQPVHLMFFGFPTH